MTLKDKVILVTGGTGSMGKTFVKRALSGADGLPKKIIVMSRDEAKQHYMRTEYLTKKNNPTDEVIYNNFLNRLQFRIGDVRSYADVLAALKGVDIVINAAALKQVPTCEYFPSQAVETNCKGVSNIVRAIHEHDLPVETVVGVSTDKACKPVNVMGMTKAIQEKIFISANVHNKNTKFVCVRYGNVLASRGSVIPFFHEQIKAGGPVTLTDNKMTRFLLSLEDAVDIVIEAIENAQPGETFIPVAPTALMENVAKALIGDRKIELVVTGIRPGEKMHEALISEEESIRTCRRGDYYVIQPMLPEVIKDNKKYTRDLIGQYASDANVLNLEDTIKLLERHDLMIEQNQEFNNSEKKEMIK